MSRAPGEIHGGPTFDKFAKYLCLRGTLGHPAKGLPFDRRYGQVGVGRSVESRPPTPTADVRIVNKDESGWKHMVLFVRLTDISGNDI